MNIGGIDVSALAKEFLDGKERNRERTQIIDRPYGPDVNRRAVVVRVDVVVMALHVVAARLAMKEFAGKLKAMLDNVRTHILSAGSGRVLGRAGKAVGSAGRILGSTSGLLANILDADLIELTKEVQIRRNCWAARRDVYRLTMSQRKHRRRKTKLVATRHRTPKQRKPNKSWHQP